MSQRRPPWSTSTWAQSQQRMKATSLLKPRCSVAECLQTPEPFGLTPNPRLSANPRLSGLGFIGSVVGFDRSGRKLRDKPPRSNSYRIDKRGNSHTGANDNFVEAAKIVPRFRNKFVGPKSVIRLDSSRVVLIVESAGASIAARSNLDPDPQARVEERGGNENALVGDVDLQAEFSPMSPVVNGHVGLQIQIGKHPGEKVEARDRRAVG